MELVGSGSFHKDQNYCRLSIVLHVLPPVAPESCFYDYGSTPPANISESLGNYNIQSGSRTHQCQFWELTSLPAAQTVEVKKSPWVTKRWLQRCHRDPHRTSMPAKILMRPCIYRQLCYLCRTHYRQTSAKKSTHQVQQSMHQVHHEGPLELRTISSSSMVFPSKPFSASNSTRAGPHLLYPRGDLLCFPCHTAGRLGFGSGTAQDRFSLFHLLPGTCNHAADNRQPLHGIFSFPSLVICLQVKL